MSEVKTWYAYFSDWQDLSKGVIQKEQWALMLNSTAEFQVVDKQAYDAQSKLIQEKDEKIKKLEEQMKLDVQEKYIILRSLREISLGNEIADLKTALMRIKGMCGTATTCNCGAPNGLAAIVFCAEKALNPKGGE